MDFQDFEFVRFPFQESQRRLQGHQTLTIDVLQAYQRLLQVGKEMAQTHLPNNNLASLYDIIDAAMGVAATRAPVNFPVLLPDAVEAFVARIDSARTVKPEQGRRIAVALLCAIYVECAELPLSIDLQSLAGTAAVLSGISSYAAWKAFSETREKSDLNISEIAARAEELIQAAVGTAQQQLQSMLERNSALQKEEALLRAQVQDTIRELKQETEEIAQGAVATKVVLQEVLKQSKENEERISLSQENIKRHADAMREEMRIDSTKQLWRQRAKEGDWAFRISAAAIAVFLVAPIWYAFSHLEGLINTLRVIGDAATSGIPAGGNASTAHLAANAVARLAVITVPLAIYFWAVKLLVRYNARSMMLMDDARQRQTMMEVYTHLIENNGATSEERALVLNALFRPAPGHGPENVDPPNFTELLGKATAKAG